MLKFSTVPKFAYLIFFIFVAIIIGIASFNLLQSGEAVSIEPEQGQLQPAADEAAAGTGSEAELDHHHDDEEAVEPGHDHPESDPKYDHHGNVIREDPAYQKVVENGASVEFTVENFLGAGGRGGEFAPEIFEGEYAVIKFNISEPDTGAPLSGLQPAAWMNVDQGPENGQEAKSCQEQVKEYVSGTLGTRPLVNFNSYFILAMNDEATISVIDPMIDVAGMTNLFTMMDLPQPGDDWVMTDDQTRLFVTIPEAGQVAVADLEKFQTFENIEVDGQPARLLFSPDGRYLWVGNDSDQAGQSGVTVIDPAALTVVAQIPTGAGHHELAFSTDGRYAFVTNRAAGSLSIIDAEELKLVKEIQVGREPAAIAFAAASRAVYVANEGDGIVTIIDGDRLEPVGRLELNPGLAGLRFDPDGRWGFLTNTSQSEVYIFDAADNRVRYLLPVQGAPDQISFSRDAAYIRARGLPSITSIPLADLGESETLTTVNLPIGQSAPGVFPALASANAILATPDEGAMLVAHPADDQIYFYVEGAPAPLGGFQGHGLNPRAVLVVDRSLREEAPGVYSGRVRIPTSGEMQVAFLLNDPKVVHCFTFEARSNPDVTRDDTTAPPEMELLSDLEQIQAGEPFKFQLLLTDPASEEPVTDIADLMILVMRAGGTWNQRYVAQPQGQGRYEVELTVPGPGPYQILLTVPSLQHQYKELPVFQFRVAAEETTS